MSNTKTFLTLSLLILLGSMGAVQAQDGDMVTRFELFTTPTQSAREGGKDEAGGAVFLTASADNADDNRKDNASLFRSAQKWVD